MLLYYIMKLSILFTGIISLMISQTRISAQSNSTRLRQAILDSLEKQKMPYAKFKEKYKPDMDLWKSAEASFPEEKIILANGAEATYRTTNNKKIREILSDLFELSPVDFLLAIRGIKGWVSIEPERVSWVKKEDIPDLIKLAQVDIVTPQVVQQYSRRMQQIHPIPIPSTPPWYYETPLGINALDLIHSYLDGIFPATTPSYESVKEWYNSGKPKEEYKHEPFFPAGKSTFVKPVWRPTVPGWLRKN